MHAKKIHEIPWQAEREREREREKTKKRAHMKTSCCMLVYIFGILRWILIAILFSIPFSFLFISGFLTQRGTSADVRAALGSGCRSIGRTDLCRHLSIRRKLPLFAWLAWINNSKRHKRKQTNKIMKKPSLLLSLLSSSHFAGLWWFRWCSPLTFRSCLAQVEPPQQLFAKQPRNIVVSKSFARPCCTPNLCGICVSQERYNPRTASWHLVPATWHCQLLVGPVPSAILCPAHEAMLQQRFAPAAAAVAGKLYVCGGADVAWQDAV